MSLIEKLIARQGAEVATQAVSHVTIAAAVGNLYQAATALRNAPRVTTTDVEDYLTPAMEEVVRQLKLAAQRKLPVLEQAPVSNLARNYEDKAADFLTEVNNGGGVQFR